MSTAPFSPEKLAALSRLSAEINASAAPPSIACPVVINEAGFVTIPVPNYEGQDSISWILGMDREMTMVSCQLHAGLTLQWSPMPGGLLLDLRGGAPDGDPGRDAVTAFLTPDGLRRLIADLQSIEAGLTSPAPSDAGSRAVGRLQAAWDSCDGTDGKPDLPPIIFTDAEAAILLAALHPAAEPGGVAMQRAAVAALDARHRSLCEEYEREPCAALANQKIATGRCREIVRALRTLPA